MHERFAIPGVGGIIEGEVQGEKAILIQTRTKSSEEGLGYLEIPAGKIREFENIFDCLRREIYEETGLTVKEIYGEKESSLVENEKYKVLGYEPFYCSQNTKGFYPIMVYTFICRVEGTHMKSSEEAKNIGFISLKELRSELIKNKSKFYPMHIGALQKYLKLMGE